MLISEPCLTLDLSRIYSDLSRHIQNPCIFEAYSEYHTLEYSLDRTLCNPVIYEPEKYAEPYQISTMKRFVQKNAQPWQI